MIDIHWPNRVWFQSWESIDGKQNWTKGKWHSREVTLADRANRRDYEREFAERSEERLAAKG